MVCAALTQQPYVCSVLLLSIQEFWEILRHDGLACYLCMLHQASQRMAFNRELFYDKHNRFKIAAFKTRINKSKVPRTFKDDSSGSSPTLSPYFAHSNGQQKPLVCSLSTHEANLYNYKLDHFERPGESFEREKTSTKTHKTVTTKLPPFKPSVATGLLTGNLNAIRGAPFSEMSFASRATSSTTKLKERLNRNVLKATPLAMSLSCKQYPRLISRNVLNKYAHLFGLEPVKGPVCFHRQHQ